MSHCLESSCVFAPAARTGEGDGEEEEYRSGEDDDADNEATIEEEEALAAAEGRDVKVGAVLHTVPARPGMWLLRGHKP